MTKQSSDGNQNIPMGMEFLKLSTYHQNRCATKSRLQLKKLPSHVQTTFEKIGDILSLMDHFASCFWVCHGKEHVIEYLVGRTVSSARAIIRLIEFGHYDEALALIRNIAEIGNLMHLFFVQPDEIRHWIDLSEKERRKKFAPVKIRKALENAGGIIPNEGSHYGLLSQIAIHPHPDVSPQAHNLNSIPTLGGIYQERGQIICVNELAWTLATVAGPAAKTAILDREIAEEIVETAISLVDSIEGINLESSPESYEEIMDSSEYLMKRTLWLDNNLRKKKAH